ncbi:unnamed protein product (macronuclear) [Paramecium tetraurelia]|uniref:Major facilitator superfamily (MFS) profile domain-containing protein n=1 Tax=Paramecium tetraurelia TaxID=5888 RepID=A0CQE3_PARTE|nr:uncharacterized protein GSPATT00009358001 [Paramecium tetraurelia]CAK73010.1 unnamed protein product [Paramecium tetraurelia]|eukprot:XP_001440407.1 hypothetical protein (macronuclear) [Paramecium tetraurelia strain d4-2]
MNELEEQEVSHYSTIQQNELKSEIQVVSHKEDHSIIKSDSIINFHDILTQIGFGRFQIMQYFVSIILGIMEGAQITIFTLMVPILKKEWEISESIVSLQTSFIFIGFLVGSMLSGQFTDRYGRKLPFIFSSLLTVLICFATILCTNVYQLLIMRGFMGIFVGFFAPCCVTLLQEITPNKLRGQMTGSVTLSVAIGQLYGFFMASLIMEGINGSWRWLTFLGSLPGLVALILSLIYIEESPRYLLLEGKYYEAFQTLKLMIRTNKATEVIIWSLYMNSIAKKTEHASFKSLLNGERLQVSLVLWSIWFLLCFSYYGNLMTMPQILYQLKDDESQLQQLVYACLSDILGAILATLIIDIKGLGRKNSLIIGFLIASVFSFLQLYEYHKHFAILAILQKLFLSMNYIFCYQLTTELYPTKLRTTGLGTAVAIGRLGVILMPWSLSNHWSISPVFHSFLFRKYFCLFYSLGKSLDNNN